MTEYIILLYAELISKSNGYKKKTSMSVRCHYKYNSELHHFRMGEYKKTNDDKQACIIEFVLFSILSTSL